MPALSSLKRTTPYLALAVAFLLIVSGGIHHELSGDEARPWLMVTDLPMNQWIEALRYEGHPALWYLLLKILSLMTPAPESIQILSSLCGLGTMAIILLRSPFTVLQKVFLSCNLFLIFQYTISARLYSIEILLLFLACMSFTRRWERPVIYLAILGLLSFSSVFGLGLAGVFFLEFFWKYLTRERSVKKYDVGIAVTALVILFSVIVLFNIAPDSYAVAQYNDLPVHSLLRWKQIFSHIGSSFFFIPSPSIGIWGRSFELDTPIYSEVYLLLALMSFTTMFRTFRKDSTTLWFFASMYLVIIFLLYFIRFSSFNFNYYGHTTIVWMSCLWIFQEKHSPGKFHQTVFTFVLLFQAVSGLTFIIEDIRKPFSLGEEAARYLEESKAEEIIPGNFVYAASYLIYTRTKFFDLRKDQLLQFKMCSRDVFAPEDYVHGVIPRGFEGQVNRINAVEIREVIRKRYCEGNTDPRMVTNYDLPRDFLNKTGLEEIKRFTGAINPLENFYIYQFTGVKSSLPVCGEQSL